MKLVIDDDLNIIYPLKDNDAFLCMYDNGKHAH